ncbi:peroxide stress protein YaaA [Roseobacter sp.]|uniref:peroxide stress protein YaaA n=1 Tax=Roseobacter sp. TaxID=1907202 RepID=UPI00385E3161
MLVVISPAKRLDWAQQDVAMTQPAFQDDAARLVKTARNLTLGNLKGLMSLSDDLARLNRDRFAAFETAPQADSTRPAALAFAGDTYQGLQAASLDHDDVIWAQEHLRILSGLYGLLRPLDAIQPYRLEMGSRLKTRRGANLYEYWRNDLSKALNSQAEKLGADLLVNCASQEYFGAVAPKALKLKVVTPAFLEDKDDGKGPRVVSFFAKKARGAMARYIIQNRCVSQLDLQGFQHGGYIFKENMSSEGKPVFVRPYPTA